MAVLAVVVAAGPSVAQVKFSRERFLSAVAKPLATLASNGDVASISRPGSLSYVDEYRLRSAPWDDLVEIPELATLTDGKRAGYLLGMAYLAAQELGIPIEKKESAIVVSFTASGLFQGNIYKNQTGVTFQVPFPVGDFQRAAIALLQNAAVGKCEFSSGWYKNDAKEIGFLNRTCSDLRTVVAAASAELDRAKAAAAAEVRTQAAAASAELGRAKAADAAQSRTGSEAASPELDRAAAAAGAAAAAQVKAGGGCCGQDPITYDHLQESDKQEAGRLTKLSQSELQTGLDTISSKTKETQIKKSQLTGLDQNGRPLNGVYVGKGGPPPLTASQQEQVQLLDAQLGELRHEAKLHVAALQVVQAQLAEARRLQEQEVMKQEQARKAEEEARKEQARAPLRDKFEASGRGKILYSVIQASLMAEFLQTHPSPLPSERSAGEKAVSERAKCIVRYVTPKDPDNMSADEKAAIDMIITDLPLRGAIRNQAVATTYALMNEQCMMDGH
jgi:hypothetical protein